MIILLILLILILFLSASEVIKKKPMVDQNQISGTSEYECILIVRKEGTSNRPKVTVVDQECKVVDN